MQIEISKPIRKYLAYLLVLLLGALAGRLFWNRVPSEPSTLEVGVNVQQLFYSCSMHPEVHLDKEGKCPYCGMDLVLSKTEGSLSAAQFQIKEEAVALANISTLPIHQIHTPQFSIELSGVLRPNEKTNTIQTTLFNGRLDRLDVNAVGDRVRKGQEIGLIYSPDLYLAQDKLLTAASYKDTHEKLYEASRYGLGLWKLTDKQVADLLKTKEPIFHFPLIADVSGTVTEIVAKAGDYYREGDALFTLSDLRTLWAVFDAYENQLQYLSVGQKVRVETQAFPGKEIAGKISFIEPLLDPVSRTVAVRVELNNRDGVLKPGMFAQARVGVEGRSAGIWIPKSAVLWTGKRSLVYLKHSGSPPIFEGREITLGTSADEYYEVLDGVRLGDEIVINGTFTVDAAAQLARKRSMMRPEPDPAVPVTDLQNPLSARQWEAPSTQALGKVMNTYLLLKDALVKSQPAETAIRAGELLEILRSNEFTIDREQFYASFQSIYGRLEKMKGTVKLDVQRAQFKPLSEGMIDLVRSLRGLESPLYVQFCPMADGNKGAYWLSMDSEIANPYFGDQMLRCGSTTEVLQ